MARTLSLRQLCQPKIENLYVAVGGDKQILRLEIAMNDSFSMSSRQAAGDLLGVPIAVPTGSAPRRNRSPSVLPSSNSLTMYGAPSCVPMS